MISFALFGIRERWPDTSGESGDYPPHHLTRWSLKAIEHFLSRNGFRIKRYKVENFPLQNMSSLMYAYILKFAKFLTMKGKGIAEHLNEMTEEQTMDLLKKIPQTIHLQGGILCHATGFIFILNIGKIFSS